MTYEELNAVLDCHMLYTERDDETKMRGVLSSLDKIKVRLIKTTYGNLPKSRTEAIRTASKQFCCWVDPDDIYFPELIKYAVEKLSQHTSNVAYTDEWIEELDGTVKYCQAPRYAIGRHRFSPRLIHGVIILRRDSISEPMLQRSARAVYPEHSLTYDLIYQKILPLHIPLAARVWRQHLGQYTRL